VRAWQQERRTPDEVGVWRGFVAPSMKRGRMNDAASDPFERSFAVARIRL
jgi:hypothetical protein